MKQYARGKTSVEFTKAAKAAGLILNTARYNEGGDHIAFAGPIQGVRVDALFNVVNSRIFGTQGPEKTQFSTDDLLDGQPWFDFLLDLANTNEPRAAT